MENKCGNCSYNSFVSNEEGFVCSNESSENYAMYTDYNDTCTEFTGKEE